MFIIYILVISVNTLAATSHIIVAPFNVFVLTVAWQAKTYAKDSSKTRSPSRLSALHNREINQCGAKSKIKRVFLELIYKILLLNGKCKMFHRLMKSEESFSFAWPSTFIWFGANYCASFGYRGWRSTTWSNLLVLCKRCKRIDSREQQHKLINSVSHDNNVSFDPVMNFH